MENQNLDGWLHARKRRHIPRVSSVHRVVLDWPKRLHIAKGAAQGLSYMHHDCSPPIIHRDVQSSNILLESKFNAKIADFGLAQMLEWSWRHYAEEKPINDAFDREIKEPDYLEEMANVFKLGLRSTSTSPMSRPSMKEVIQILCHPTRVEIERPLFNGGNCSYNYKHNKDIVGEKSNSIFSVSL